MSTRAAPGAVSSRSAAPPPPARARARKASARRRRVLAVVVLVAVLAAIAYGVSRSPLLAVNTLKVTGTSHVTTEQVLDAAGVHDGDPMVWMDPGAAVRGIEALPYVRVATVQRQWPDTVRITVRERTPSAWIDGPGGKALVDGTGRVLDVVDTPPPAVPQLLGAKVVPTPGGTIDAVGAARVAGGLGGLAGAGTASVELTDHGVVLHLVSGPEVRMGDADRIAVKLRAAWAVLDATRDAPPAYVDVSVPTNPVVG